MSKNVLKVNPMHIHIALIIVIIALLFLYFLDDVEFGGDKINDQELITLIGDLKEFNETYVGDVLVYSSDFRLVTPTGKFDVKSSEVDISDFNGSIFLGENETIILKGVAKEIEYGTNQVNLNGQEFLFVSSLKTSMDLYFEELYLDFDDGLVKIGEDLNYDFVDSNITINKFNTSFNFDGTFLFTGYADDFIFKSKEPSLNIVYQK